MLSVSVNLGSKIGFSLVQTIRGFAQTSHNIPCEYKFWLGLKVSDLAIFSNDAKLKCHLSRKLHFKL